MSELTIRQREVLNLIAAGKTQREVAEQLGIRRDGVRWHLRAAADRLGVVGEATRAKVLAAARERGLVDA